MPDKKGVLGAFLPVCTVCVSARVCMLFSENFVTKIIGLILDTIIISHESLKQDIMSDKLI